MPTAHKSHSNLEVTMVYDPDPRDDNGPTLGGMMGGLGIIIIAAAAIGLFILLNSGWEIIIN